MASWKRGTVAITVMEGIQFRTNGQWRTEIVPALIRGNLAVTPEWPIQPDRKRYEVTHVPTGKTFGYSATPTQREAKALADRIETLCPDVVATTTEPDVQMRINEWEKSTGRDLRSEMRNLQYNTGVK